ncbi:hypothetical protein [Pseudomonas sp. Fl5BN2]|uniref:hypothetical protein n=1 Tax=Pseudomonas sp. Fl5BN2 TaxID=2697652 RepID=UPI002114C3F8|nr:hypothetical protein [Pseudomonas sp. Fl5BN2]
MLSEQQACAIVLARHAGILRDGIEERFVIQSCELSANGDYWVVRCNTEDCVVHGITTLCYVGVNAHLVNLGTGEVETVPSPVSIEDHLQDCYDRNTAAGRPYVLAPTFGRDNQPAMINLRQKLACSYPEVIALLSEEQRHWLTGTRRQLQEAQQLLASQGIATAIELTPQAPGAVAIGVEVWHVDAAIKALRNRLQ